MRNRPREARRAARAALMAAALAAAGATGAAALDRLTFRIPAEPEGLRDALTGASLLGAAVRDGNTGPQEILGAARGEYGNLLGVLYAEGHYSGVIRVTVDGREADGLSPLTQPDGIGEVVVTVLPGPPFAFGRAEVAPLAPGTELPEGFAPGGPARAALIRSTADAAVRGWRAQSRAKAALDGQQITADHRARTLDAELSIAPGPALRFGRLNVAGNDRLREARLRAIAGFPSGERFDPEALAEVNTRLVRSGVFRSVALREAETPNPDGTLDIDLTVVEEAPRRIGFGGEVASFDGVTLGGFWLHRNLLGGGERFRVDGEIAGIGAQLGGADFSLGATFTRPATFDPDTSFYLGAEVERLDQEDFDADNLTLSGGFRRTFSDRLTGEAGLEYSFSEVTDLTGERTFQTISAPLRLTWDGRDAPLDATDGFYLDGQLEPFVGFDGAGTGARAFVDARAYRGFGDRFVLAGRAQAGTIFGATLRETPRDMLFYSGGGGTVRGHPFQSLGVFVLRDDQRSGGRSFFATSGELRVDITDTIGAVGFVDTGFVSAGEFLTDSGDWHTGAGIGLRYDTGIGPIRFDVAGPVSGDTGEGVQFYIGIGQAF